jgi:hypothetical protein
VPQNFHHVLKGGYNSDIIYYIKEQIWLKIKTIWKFGQMSQRKPLPGRTFEF